MFLSFIENILNSSQLWNETDFPPIPVGVVTLDENPENYFTTVEQVALNPANLISGIELGIRDFVTQSRNLIYRDSHFHRSVEVLGESNEFIMNFSFSHSLGPNFFQLKVNEPKSLKSTAQDGPCRQPKKIFESNYYPSMFSHVATSQEKQMLSGRLNQTTLIRRFNTLYDDNYSQVTTKYSYFLVILNFLQVRRYWNSLDKGHQKRLAKRYSADISKMKESARRGLLDQIKLTAEDFHGKVVYYLKKLENP